MSRTNFIKKQSSGFTITSNELINDFELSPQARFLYIYLYSKPEDWEFNNKNLSDALGGVHRETLNKYKKELIDKGWIEVSQERTSSGGFGRNRYMIYAQPLTDVEKNGNGKTPMPKNTDAEKNGSRENRQHSNKDLLSNTDLFSNTNGQNEFEIFWKKYDKKTKKQDALKAWAKLTQPEKIKALEHVEPFVKSRPEKKFRPDPVRYLRKKMYNDEIIQPENATVDTTAKAGFTKNR